MAQSSSNKKITNGLVALSSAAVLAVYSAGYARTRSAADQLEAQSAERRPLPPGMGRGVARAGSPSGASGQALQENSAGSAPAPADFAAKPHNSDNQPALVASVEPLRSASSTAPAASGSSSTSAISALSVAPSSAASAQPGQPNGSQQTQSSQSQASSYSSVAPSSASNSAPSAPSAPSSSAFQIPLIPPIASEHKTEAVSAAPAKAAAPAWKDGTYFGWGSCRHGDIQAEVYVEGGRIIVASISDCRTRYACNVIDKLPPEVAQRQSPEVDYVSGATESATAFYYAVVDALSKAK
jgi:uncharacterized protein with FMN-binding domain